VICHRSIRARVYTRTTDSRNQRQNLWQVVLNVLSPTRAQRRLDSRPHPPPPRAAAVLRRLSVLGTAPLNVLHFSLASISRPIRYLLRFLPRSFHVLIYFLNLISRFIISRDSYTNSCVCLSCLLFLLVHPRPSAFVGRRSADNFTNII
jgi:hypothetical protein